MITVAWWDDEIARLYVLTYLRKHPPLDRTSWRLFTPGSTLAEKAFDIACGQHSGIPPCCIAFYVDEWPALPGWDKQAWLDEESMTVQYVRCPRCRERGGAPIEIKRCRCVALRRA